MSMLKIDPAPMVGGRVDIINEHGEVFARALNRATADQIVADHAARSREASLRTKMKRLQDLIHDANTHDYDRDGDGCFEECFVCEADMIVNAALQSPPAAPEGQGRGRDERSGI